MRQFRRKLSRMGRRGFLKTLAGLGVSAATLDGLDKDTFEELIDDPKTEVPRVHSYVHTNHEAVVENGAAPTRKPIYYKIPRHQWVRVEAAHDARDRIGAKIEKSHAAAFVTTNSNGEKLIRIRVYDDGSLGSDAVDQVEQTVPETIDGVAGRGTDIEEKVQDIPVTVVREKIDPRPLPDDASWDPMYWDDWDAVPAGACGYFENVFGDPFPATLCAPVYDDSDGSHKMITAGHCTENGDSVAGRKPKDEMGFTVEKDDNSSGVGPGSFDAALLDGVAMQYTFATDYGTTSGEILGTVSESKLKDIEDNGTGKYETFKRQGARTGESTQFGITEIQSEGFVTDLDESKTKGGDSGGPYHIYDDAPYVAKREEMIFPDEFDPQWNPFSTIAGVHQGLNSDYGSHPCATSMYRVEKKWEVEV